MSGSDDVIRLDPDVATARTGTGMVLYHGVSGDLHELDDMGAAFWEAIDATATFSDAVDRLAAEFEVDRATVSADLRDFVASLAEAGLLATDPTDPDYGRPDPVAHLRDRHLQLTERALLGLLHPGSALEAVPVGAHRFDRIDQTPVLTMIGAARLRNVRRLVEQVLADGIPGDLMECGVWRGGAAIMMRAVLAAHEVTDRQVWLADSFAGLPAVAPGHHPADDEWATQTGLIAVGVDEVAANFRRFGLLDPSVRFVEGWFEETLPTVPVERLALLRLDGDLHASTIQALTHLYHRVVPGGFVIVDDMAHESCRVAVHEFRTAHGIDAEIHHVDWTGIWWRVP